MMKYLADIPLGKEPFRGFGPLGLEGADASTAGGVFNKIISSTVGIMTVIAFIWFIFLLLTGGFGIMQAGGDAKALESAKKRIFTAVYGLFFVIASIFLIRLIGYLMGIPNILNPADFIENLNNSTP